MAREFEKFIPELKQQRERFEKTFGKDVARGIEQEAERFRSGFDKGEITKQQAQEEARKAEEAKLRAIEEQRQKDQLIKEANESARRRNLKLKATRDYLRRIDISKRLAQGRVNRQIIFNINQQRKRLGIKEGTKLFTRNKLTPIEKTIIQSEQRRLVQQGKGKFSPETIRKGFTGELIKEQKKKFKEEAPIKKIISKEDTKKIMRDVRRFFFPSIKETLTPSKFKPVSRVELSDVTKVFFNNLERKGFSKKRISNIVTAGTFEKKFIDKVPRLNSVERKLLKRFADERKKILEGALEEIEEKPEQVIITGAAGGMLPKALAKLGASKFVIKALKKIPKKIKKKGAKAISRTLTGAYLTSTGLRVVTAEEPSKQIGRIAVGEVVPFQVGTKLGVRGLMREELKKEINKALKGMSKQRQQAFRDYMKQAEVFGKYEPEARNIKLNNIESIPDPKAQKVVRKFLKVKDVIVGGSVAQTAQINVKRKLGDMDLYIRKGSPKATAKNLANQLKKAGVKRVSTIRGQVTIAGKKAIEFHNVERIKQNIEQVIPTWASWKKYIIKTPEGIEVQRIGLQARRKLVAAFADPQRLATGKYSKDLKDFKQISDKIFKQAVKKSKNAFFFKKQKLKAVEKIFKKKIKKPKITKKLKKPKVVKKVITPARKKVRVIGVGIKKIKKISKKELQKIRLASLAKARAKLKKIRKIKKKPSQKPPKKRKPTRPSQPPRKPPKKPKPIPTYKPPRKPPKKPPQPPRPPPTRKSPPSQPPVRPPKKPPQPPRPPPPIKPPKRPPVKPPKKPPKIPKKTKKIKKFKIKKAIPVFNVFGKSRKKFVKLNVKPLTKTDALSRGAFAVDRTTARTFKIVPAGTAKTAGALLKKEKGYFSKVRDKLRNVRIKRGKKFKLTNKYIEKRKYGIDTSGERRGLKIRRAIVRRKRKITSAQRKVLLKNLAKARKAKGKKK